MHQHTLNDMYDLFETLLSLTHDQFTNSPFNPTIFIDVFDAIEPKPKPNHQKA